MGEEIVFSYWQLDMLTERGFCYSYPADYGTSFAFLRLFVPSWLISSLWEKKNG